MITYLLPGTWIILSILLLKKTLHHVLLQYFTHFFLATFPHHYHLPPWIRSFDLFQHRRIAIVSWGVLYSFKNSYTIFLKKLL